ncbi:MAG: hypothetical protein II272_02230 [Oscillospiraceae bacterium]|nr:hypothetical protein [Oscillospiraceae bacterium]
MQTVRAGMQFVRAIGAVVLWVVFEWNRCSEPSQALRASSPGGRAKSQVGIADEALNFDLSSCLSYNTVGATCGRPVIVGKRQ